MAETNETNAEAKRARGGKMLPAAAVPNRATRRKKEALGELPPAPPAPVMSTPEASDAAEVQPPFAAAMTPKIEPAAILAQAVAAKDAEVEPAKFETAVDAPATEPAPVEPAAELTVYAMQADAPASLHRGPALADQGSVPVPTKTQSVIQAGIPAFSIKDMTMDMSTNFNGFQSAITEAQAKAKAAFEKSSSAMGEMGEFTKGNVEAAIESGKIFAEGFQEIGSTLVAESRTAFETMTGDIKELAAAKSPTDFLKIQSDMLRKSFDSAVAYGSKNSEAFLKLMSDAAAPLSGRVSLAVEKARQTAAQTTAGSATV